MDKYQPILPKTNLSSFLFFFICGMIFLAIGILSIYDEGWGYFGTAIISIFGIISIIFSILIAKSKHQPTPEAKKEAKQKTKEREDQFYSKWYMRYFGVICALIIAYISYVSYTTGFRMNGLGLLLFNPVTGIISAIVAIFGAWEISLIAVVVVILYYIYIGMAALPVSVAIIIGSMIIAYGVYKYKA